MSRLRGALLFPLFIFSLPASAQAPDIRVRLDLALTLDWQHDRRPTARLYTPLGRPSTIGLTAALESGYNLVVAERLQRLPHDADGDILDEAYVEDPGIFRVGKQYIPFGAGRILRESVLAARLDSNLIAEDFPVSLVGIQNGDRRQSGVVVRMGRAYGLSLAYGEHFGIAGTSLGVTRHPEDAFGRGGGWKQAVGFDASQRYGKVAVSSEFASLNGGPQRSIAVLDAEVSVANDAYHSIGAGYTHKFGNGDADLFRLFGRVHATRNFDVEPLLRLRNGHLYDLAATLRFRL